MTPKRLFIKMLQCSMSRNNEVIKLYIFYISLIGGLDKEQFFIEREGEFFGACFTNRS